MSWLNVLRIGGTLLIGAIGGWALDLINMPLAWMLGAMMSTAILSAAGVPLRSWGVFRAIMLGVLGVAIGSTFSPEALGNLSAWAFSLTILAGYSVIVTIVGVLLLRRVTDWSLPTVFFSAVPGGLTDMIIAGTERGGDERIMAMIHTLRIMVTVLCIPLAFTLTGNVPSNVMQVVAPAWSGLSPDDLIWLIGAGVGGVIVAKLVRLPAYVFTGPMIMSAAVHLIGLSASRPPADLVNAAQVVIGVSIGCRFVGIRVREIARVMIIGILFGVFLVAVGGGLAAITATVTDLTFASLWLAFAPGGMAEMIVMGLALGLDPAFVSTHHLFRFVLILTIARSLYSLYGRFSGAAPLSPD